MTALKNNATIYSIILLALAVAGNANASDYFPFRVAFEDVPGVAEITSGQVSEGIEILKQELDNDDANKGYVLATLCGAYILESSLEEATRVCTDAVETFPGETAFNNRGVLRAFSGDFEGAKEDFDRARPQHMAEYIEYLKTKDVGLIANGNHDLLEDLAALHSSVDVQSSVAMSAGSELERFDD